MTEITRVPIQPVTKGSVAKLWLGVAAAVLIAGVAAWATLPPMVQVTTIKAGTGVSPTVSDVVLIDYKGTLPSGKVFDEQKGAAFPVEGVVPGFTKALLQMQKGGQYKVVIPSELAYGNKQAGEIPPNTDLNFDITLTDFRSRAEIEQQQRMMQQIQQMQAQQGGPGGAPAGPDGAPAIPQGGAVPPPPGQ